MFKGLPFLCLGSSSYRRLWGDFYIHYIGALNSPDKVLGKVYVKLWDIHAEARRALRSVKRKSVSLYKITIVCSLL